MTEEEGEREGQGEYIMGKIISLRKYFRPLKNLKNQEKKKQTVILQRINVFNLVSCAQFDTYICR